MKRLFEATLCVAVIIAALSAYNAVSFATERYQNQNNYYSEIGVVVDVGGNGDLVTVRTSLNLNYQFIANGWDVGDMCSLLMDDMDTRANLLDDIIIETRYVGNPTDYKL